MKYYIRLIRCDVKKTDGNFLQVPSLDSFSSKEHSKLIFGLCSSASL